MPLSTFGRSRNKGKAAPAGRHHDGDEPTGQAGDDHEFSSYLAALAPEADDPENTGTDHRFGDAEVYQLRLAYLAGQQLKDIATERGTSPQALVQEWVLERLAWEGQATPQAEPQSPPRPQSGSRPPAAPRQQPDSQSRSAPRQQPEGGPRRKPSARQPDDPPTDELYLGEPQEWKGSVHGSFR